MSALPDRWPEPGSRIDARNEVAWFVLAVAVFGALAAFEPLFVTVSPSTPTVVASAAVGAALGVTLVYASYGSARLRSLLVDSRRRFVVLFAFVMAGQGLLRLAPAATILTALAAFAAAIPARLTVYLRHRN